MVVTRSLSSARFFARPVGFAQPASFSALSWPGFVPAIHVFNLRGLEQCVRQSRRDGGLRLRLIRLTVCARHCEPSGRANARPTTGSAKQSSSSSQKILPLPFSQWDSGLLRRVAPLRKRSAFVAGNDGNEGVVARRRGGTDLPAMSSLHAKNISLRLEVEAVLLNRPSRLGKRGVCAIVTKREAGCGGRGMSLDEGCCCGR
jgi:hypothetical protein